MQVRVSDVHMRLDDNDKVPLFTVIPQCAAQEIESAQDFLTGDDQRWSLSLRPDQPGRIGS
jgi:conjugative transfer pilus assembly protein TraH